MSTNEQALNTDRTPTAEELSEIKSRVATIRTALEDAGLQPSMGATTGTKVVRYFTKLAGVTPKEMTVAQWSAGFATLEGLMNDPKKAVEVIDEWGRPTEEEAKIATQRQAEMEETSRKEQEEQRKKRDKERKERDERAGPHAKRIKELAAEFLRKIEAEGYEGYAIVGIPNGLIEAKFEEHLESCEACDCDEPCDEDFNAMYEDGCFESVFILKTPYAGDTGDYAGLAWELGGDGRDGMYPYTNDLLDAAEPYQPELNGKAAAA